MINFEDGMGSVVSCDLAGKYDPLLEIWMDNTIGPIAYTTWTSTSTTTSTTTFTTTSTTSSMSTSTTTTSTTTTTTTTEGE